MHFVWDRTKFKGANLQRDRFGLNNFLIEYSKEGVIFLTGNDSSLTEGIKKQFTSLNSYFRKIVTLHSLHDPSSLSF